MGKRMDDAFGRKIIGALIVALIVEGLGWVYSVGVLVNKIDTLAKSVIENKREIEQLRKVNNRLIRIEVLMETVVVGNNKNSENQAIFSAEQQRRGPLIEDATRHLRNARVHK